LKIKSIGIKVSLIVALMITVIVVVIVLIVSAQSSALIMEITKKEAAGANVSFSKQMEGYARDAARTANIIAYSNKVIDAIMSGDDNALKEALLDYGANIDTVMVTDSSGNVIM